MQLINNKKKQTSKAIKQECKCINPVVKEVSFNEGVELDYDKIGHKYLFNGQALDSVTTFLGKYYKPFDVEMISKACGKSWNIEPQIIDEIWDGNKNFSALFGTAIHDALEHYEKYKAIGRIISDIRDEEDNYALPKHPLLRKIVKEFIEINTIEGEVKSEVLLTDVKNGLAGRADRIVIQDLEKKICRIGDYKVNVDSDVKKSNLKPFPPFDSLPNNKITKYQIQMSIYANMLQKCGWTVTGLDVYIYEDGWRYYNLPVLEVLKESLKS